MITFRKASFSKINVHIYMGFVKKNITHILSVNSNFVYGLYQH